MLGISRTNETCCYVDLVSVHSILIAAGFAALAACSSESAVRSTPPSVSLATSTTTLVAGSSGALPQTRRLRVEGEAMAPTLHDGDHITVAVPLGPMPLPSRFDIIVFRKADAGSAELMLVKRVVGLPGERIEVANCQVSVNGVPISEPFVDLAQQRIDGCGSDQMATLVPDAEVFVLGDNRGRSSDSRAFGPVPVSDIVGTVIGSDPA